MVPILQGAGTVQHCTHLIGERLQPTLLLQMLACKKYRNMGTYTSKATSWEQQCQPVVRLFHLKSAEHIHLQPLHDIGS